MIRATRPNENSAQATIQNTQEGLKVEVFTDNGDTILLVTLDRCMVQALYPLGDRAGDVGIWIPELRVHVWVGSVAIVDDGIPTTIEIRTNGLEIKEE